MFLIISRRKLTQKTRNLSLTFDIVYRSREAQSMSELTFRGIGASCPINFSGEDEFVKTPTS